MKPCIISLGLYEVNGRNDRQNDEEMEKKLLGGFSDFGFSIVFVYQQRHKPANDFITLYDLFSENIYLGLLKMLRRTFHL